MEVATAGFVSVHVSGLPSCCEDAAIEAELRKALDRIGTCGMLAVKDESSSLDALLASLDGPDGDPKSQVASEKCNEEGGATVSDEQTSKLTPESAVAAEAASLRESSWVDRADITGTTLTWTDGTITAIEFTSEREIRMVFQDEVCTAKLEVDGRLHWSDGDVWERDSNAKLLSDSCFSCLIPRKKTGECKGFCFLEFETLKTAEAAVRIFNAGVQIASCIISAQLAKQNGATVSEGYARSAKVHTKSAKLAKEEAVYLPAMRIKRQGYNTNFRAAGEEGGPPLRKNRARPILEEKSGSTLMKALETKVKVERAAALLALEGGEQHLQLQNGQEQQDPKLALTDIQS